MLYDKDTKFIENLKKVRSIEDADQRNREACRLLDEFVPQSDPSGGGIWKCHNVYRTERGELVTYLPHRTRLALIHEKYPEGIWETQCVLADDKETAIATVRFFRKEDSVRPLVATARRVARISERDARAYGIPMDDAESGGIYGAAIRQAQTQIADELGVSLPYLTDQERWYLDELRHNTFSWRGEDFDNLNRKIAQQTKQLEQAEADKKNLQDQLEKMKELYRQKDEQLKQADKPKQEESKADDVKSAPFEIPDRKEKDYEYEVALVKDTDKGKVWANDAGANALETPVLDRLDAVMNTMMRMAPNSEEMTVSQFLKEAAANRRKNTVKARRFRNFLELYVFSPHLSLGMVRRASMWPGICSLRWLYKNDLLEKYLDPKVYEKADQ